jgi:hypothetical protein
MTRRGEVSIIREGRHKTTKQKVAVKYIPKKYVDQEELKLLRAMACVSYSFSFIAQVLDL